jgi:chromosomal replication initiator protein
VATDGLGVENDILEYVAARIQSNIRELEGALIRVVAFSSLTKTPTSLDLARSVLKDVFSENSRPVSIQKVQVEVCRYFNISKVDLVSNRRSRSIVFPRQIAMYLTRELTDLSLPKIGEQFGGRDHTTVMHANSKIEKLLNTKREIYNIVQELTNKVKQP